MAVKIPEWFNWNEYLNNKLAQVNSDPATKNPFTMDFLVSAMNSAGFKGPEGYYMHFLQYGHKEDVSPSAGFDATQYYTFKAAKEYHAGDVSKVNSADISTIKQAIADAGMDAWTHYQKYGTAEMINASNSFDTAAYLQAKAAAMGSGWDAAKVASAIQTAGMNAYEHYKMYAGTDPSEVSGDLNVTVDPSKQANVAGQTFTLTTGVDALTGTANNDTFVAVDSATDTADTLNSGDSINGAAGTDTLKITVADNDTPAFSTSGVENVTFVATTASGALNAANWAGVQKIAVENSGIEGNTTATATVTNLQNNVALGLKNVKVAVANNDALNVSFASGKVGSDKATLSISAEDAGSSARTADLLVTTAGTDKFTTIDVAATGKNYIGLEDTGTSVAPTTLKASGTGSLTLAASTGVDFSEVTSADFSANSGGVTVNLSANTTKDISVTGGSGKDSVTVGIANNTTVAMGAGDDTVTLSGTVTTATLTDKDSIDGGEGTDTIVMTAAEANKTAGLGSDADRTAIKNFETLRLTTDTSGNTVDVDKFSASTINSVSFNAAVSAGTVEGLDSGATAEFRSATNSTGVILTMTGATNSGTDSDTLNIKFNADLGDNASVSNTGIAVAGINILNVSTADRDNDDGLTSATVEGYTLGLALDANVKTINLTGDRALSYAVSGSATALQKIDASAFAGALTLNANSFAGSEGLTILAGTEAASIVGTGLNDSITGGAKNDVLTGGAGKDAIVGGAGSDYIDGGAGADTMTGGADSDTFLVSTVGAVDAANMVIDTITDMDFTNDRIQVATAPTAISNVTANLDGQSDIAGAVSSAASAVGANNAGTFTYKGDTYLLINDGTGAFGTGDTVVKVTNSTGTLSTNSFTTNGVTLTGTAADDTLTGTTLADNINGGAGNDTINGGAGNDTINGGAGNDTITGGAGADVIDTGAGLDTVVVAAGDTVLTIGGTGNAGTIAGFDVVSNLAAGTGTVNSETLNTVGTASVVTNTTGVDGTDSTLTIGGNVVASHAITNGIVTFDDAGTFATALTIATAADVAAVVQYLQANDLGNAGATVAFDVGADTYVYTQGSDAGTDNTLDVLVQLVGVQATSLITTNATTANALFIA